jgi:polyribonucleotide nucleotidyltransferase
MVEANAKEVSDDDMLKTLEKAHSLVKELCNAQSDYIKIYEREFGIPEVE